MAAFVAHSFLSGQSRQQNLHTIHLETTHLQLFLATIFQPLECVFDRPTEAGIGRWRPLTSHKLATSFGVLVKPFYEHKLTPGPNKTEKLAFTNQSSMSRSVPSGLMHEWVGHQA
jgi:hypothetical protein